LPFDVAAAAAVLPAAAGVGAHVRAAHGRVAALAADLDDQHIAGIHRRVDATSAPRPPGAAYRPDSNPPVPPPPPHPARCTWCTPAGTVKCWVVLSNAKV
jgi:hypothetical protein